MGPLHLQTSSTGRCVHVGWCVRVVVVSDFWEVLGANEQAGNGFVAGEGGARNVAVYGG